MNLTTRQTAFILAGILSGLFVILWLVRFLKD